MSKLAIITGASRGIGLATATRFLSEGWEVWNLSRSPCVLDGVVNYACNLTDSAEVQAVAANLALAIYARISLVHNAALTCKDNCYNATEANLARLFQVNVIAPQLLNAALLPRLPQTSSVIFIGSTLSERGVPESLSYTTTKHALAGLMKATCQDLAGSGIHTCLICPGMTDTQMLREEVFPDAATLQEAVSGAVLFGRLVAPEEIADLAFFCSNNPAINGSVIHANLGQR